MESADKDKINSPELIRELIKEVSVVINDTYLSDCYSSSKNEITFSFRQKNLHFFLRFYVNRISLIYFPDSATRAKKDLSQFEELINQQIIGLDMPILSDRFFNINFTENYKLQFRLFGKNGNVLLYKNDELIDYFLEKGLNTVTNFDSINAIFTNEKQLSPVVVPPDYKINKNVFLDLIPFSAAGQSFLEALNTYASNYFSFQYYTQTKDRLTKQTEVNIKSFTGKLLSFTKSLEKLNLDQSHKERADVIMANLDFINNGNFIIFDFYNNKEIEIKLPKDTPAHKYAEKLYRKAKNKDKEVQNFLGLIEEFRSKIEKEKDFLNHLIGIDNPRDLKKFSSKTNSTKKQEASPFHTFNFENYNILVGKSAQSNDILTFKYSSREDLWLHAFETEGSHVVIQNPSKKEIPKNVIERASQLAAFHSKSKHSEFVSVQFTKRKYVTKPRGANPGKVHLLNFETIIVEPKK